MVRQKRLPSYLEAALEDMLTKAGLTFEREFRFDPDRRWRFDFAWPSEKVAVELNGGVWNGGGHIRPGGYEKDIEKYRAATLQGWRVLVYTAKQFGPHVIEDIERVKKWNGTSGGS